MSVKPRSTEVRTTMLIRLTAVLLLSAVAGVVQAQCQFEIEVGDTLKYSVDTMTVDSSCDTVTVTLTHTGSLSAAAMGHNWVLSQPAHVQPIASAGTAAGLAGDYLPENDDRIIASTEIIGGGESTTTEFALDGLDRDEYTFFCSFPGHWAVMKGTFKIV